MFSIALFFALAGALACFVLMKQKAPPLVDREKLSVLANHDLDEYAKIKDVKLKCLKADELLGKLVRNAMASSDLGPRSASLFAQAASPPIYPIGAPDPSPSSQPDTGDKTAPRRTPITLEEIDTAGTMMNSNLLKQWAFLGDGKDDYTSGINLGDGPHQAGALYISAIVANPQPWAQLTRGVEGIDGLLGNTVRFSAYIRVQGVDKAKMGVRADGQSPEGLFEFKEFKGTQDWTKVNVYIDVPNNAKMFQLSISLTGKGSIAISEPSYEVLQ